MALTSAQKANIIYLLGYSAKSIIPDSIQYDPILVSRLDNLTSDVEAIVTKLLSRITKIETQMVDAPGRVLVKRVDDIELNTGEMTDLQVMRRRWIRELASLLDIPYRGGGGMNVSVCC